MTQGINTLLLSTGALGSFTCLGMTLPIYMGPTALPGFRATGDTLSNVESQVFTPYNFGSSRDRTPRPQPRLSVNTWIVLIKGLIPPAGVGYCDIAILEDVAPTDTRAAAITFSLGRLVNYFFLR